MWWKASHKRHAGRKTRRGGFGFSKGAFQAKMDAAKAAALRAKDSAGKAFTDAKAHPAMQNLAQKAKNAATSAAAHAQVAKQHATQYAQKLQQKAGKRKTRKHRRHRKH